MLKKRLWHRCFLVNFAKFIRMPYLQNASGCLLLNISESEMWRWFFTTLYYIYIYTEVRKNVKNASSLIVKARCWSKYFTNFMQVLPSSIKCSYYNSYITLQFGIIFTWENRKVFIIVCSWIVESISFQHINIRLWSSRMFPPS